MFSTYSLIMFGAVGKQCHEEQVAVIDDMVQWVLNRDLGTLLKSEQ
uniref:Uncharacterized protein n=1 Tax=Anguilla anguilla TaxID=7936 RepID=A0A0E9SSV3_ANGAN